MSKPNEEREAVGRRHEPACGLVANGSAGRWDVNIDETTEGEEQWFAQIEGPSVYLYFEVSSPAIVDELVRFFERPSASRGVIPSLHVGSFGDDGVDLVRDDEYPDRCFIVIGRAPGATVRVALTGNDLADLTEALRQVREDLREAGLLKAG